MSVRTVRLDNETENVLQQLVKATGLSISGVFKRGLQSLRSELSKAPRRSPYEVYEQLDLGPGGYSIAPSTETRRGVQAAIRRKLNR